MSDRLTVEALGGESLSKEQAKYFALSIFDGVKLYVKEHRAEFEAWQREQVEVSARD